MKKLMRRREVTWEDPMVGAALALDLSGLDYLRAIAASGQITGPDGTLYAHATTTCLAISPRHNGGNGHER
jgi:hypothetical protein